MTAPGRKQGNDRALLIVGRESLRLHVLTLEGESWKLLESVHVETKDVGGSHSRAVLAILTQTISLKRVEVVLTDQVYRSQTEFLPPAKRRHATTILRRLAEPDDNEFILADKLALTRAGKNAVQSWQIAAVRHDILDAVLEELRHRHIRVLRTVLDIDVSKALALHFCAAGSSGAETLFIAVSETTLDLVYVVKNQVVFSRRLGITPNSDLSKRLSSEIRRTNVYFHRKYPDIQVDRALIWAPPDRVDAHLAEQVREVNQLTETELIEAPAPESFADAGLSSWDSGTVIGLAQLRRNDLSRMRAVETPNAKRHRSRQRFAPSLVAVVALFAGTSFYYLLSLEDALVQRRLFLQSLGPQRILAETRLETWNKVRTRTREVLDHAMELEALVAADIDLAALLEEWAQLLPEGVRINKMKLEDTSRDLRPDGTPIAQWSGRITFESSADYFTSHEVIEKTCRQLAKCAFFQDKLLEHEVPPSAMPWNPRADSKDKRCRFILRFRSRNT